MDSAPMASISYEYKGKNNCIYSVEIKQNEAKIDISIQDKNSIICGKFKISLSLEELYKYNKFFKQYDTIEEAYQVFTEIENINEFTSIEVDKDLLKFRLTIPSIPKMNSNKCIDLILKGEKMNENDILYRLCEKVKEIDVLKRKNDYLFFVLGKTQKDFENYERMKESLPDLLASFPNLLELNRNIDGSKIIQHTDLVVVKEGITKKLNKKIKDIKLLYRASKDGDSGNTFHSKCDGISNTVTFVKAKNGKKLGGFTEKGWNSNNQWYSDNNTFLFSLDSNECYFYKESSCMLGSSSYGPFWGSGHDLCLTDKCLSNNSNNSTQSSSFEYNGKMNCLSGEKKFQVEDYETYQLILE